jgi:hypothetical protein
MRIVLFLASFIAMSHARALEIERFDIEKDGRVYYVDMTFTIAAPADDVIAVLTDYGRPDRLNPDVRKQEVISVRGAVTRVQTEVRSCLFVFCRNITLIQDVTVESGTILADIVPESSDFRSGSMRWSVTGTADNLSRVVYTADMEPDVFIPPLIGRTLIRKMLENDVLGAAAKLESEATSTTAP